MTTQEILHSYISGLVSALKALPVDDLEEVINVLWGARLRQNRIFIAGNGGSASTASHMVVDLNKLTITEGLPRVRAVSLVDNVPSLTAWANDTDYSQVFSQQLENLASPDDVFIGISTSGTSPNILRAAETAAAMGLARIGLIAGEGGKLRDLVKYSLVVDSDHTGQIEDVHHAIGHLLAAGILSKGSPDANLLRSS